ncbi:MAG: GNAT family N-acetyltransferase [Usitatibacter sp.]
MRVAERFERPHTDLARSYRELVREFIDRGEPLVPFTLEFAHEDFAALVLRLEACARGEGLPAGFVAHSTFWLVDGTGAVVGVSNLRHALTDKLRVEGGNIGYGVRPSARRRGHATEMLRRTLDEARGLGLADVLLTCAKANAGSIATIAACGGRLESEEFIAARGEVVQRYWIALGAG